MCFIQCPKCGVKYTVEKPQEKVIKCMDCGADYFTEDEMLKIGKIIEDKNKCII